MNIWNILEIGATHDLTIIKKAYAKKLKENKPEVDPKGFQLLRQAYEMAQHYAAGLNNKDEIHVDNTQASMHQEHTQQASGSNEYNASHLVYELLDLLEKDEGKAIEKLKYYHENKFFDDLEFTEKFEQIIAINLLAISINYYNFMCYVAEVFDWCNEKKIQTQNSYFRLALINIINRINPYRYVRTISYLSNIKNKKEAKQLQLNWNDCYAARILLRPLNKLKSRLIYRFSANKRNAIFVLIDNIQSIFPEIIGRGLSIPSYVWWHKKFMTRTRKQGNTSSFLYLTFLFIFYFIISCPFMKDAFNEIRASEERAKFANTHTEVKSEALSEWERRSSEYFISDFQ